MGDVPLDRRDLRRSLFGLASGQGGYFTASQAREIGYSHQAQAHHVQAGNWHRVDRALFRLTEWVPGIHDDLARWTLWSAGKGVVSHESALAVYDVGEFESPRVHLTVPPGFRKRDDGVEIHVVAVPPEDVVEHAGFRVTTAVRSLVDLARSGVDEEQLARAIEEARSRGLVTARQLRERAEAVDPKGALYIERALGRTATS